MGPVTLPRLERLATGVVDGLPSGLTADARVTYSRFGTMRFANSWIHQPMLEERTVVSLRVCDDRRLGTATSDDLTPSGLRALVRTAIGLAHVAPRDAKFPGFAGPNGERPGATPFSTATARIDPEGQGRAARRAIETALDEAPGARVSGVVNQGLEMLAVANTSDLVRSMRRSMLQSSVLVERPESESPVSGWSEGAHWDHRSMDAGRLGREAAERMPTEPPQAARPGTYRVLLAGPALSEAIAFLGFLGFAGKADEDGWSCLVHRRGRTIAPPSVNLIDDARSPLTLPAAIDYEGMVKRATPLIYRGRAKPAVVDLVTSGHLQSRPTGHAPPPETPYGEVGATPTQMILGPGPASFDDLVRAVGDGILVTRFHYVRVVHPGRAVITGMTRDGTYRITGGRLAAPLKNLRFTESVLRILRGIEMLGRDRRCYADERGYTCVNSPAAVVGKFAFTSATLF
ncbi:MAG: metallopeptidase TldD-related protein [Thermoplasmata archaeon]|nr:metallopeptidase TldD-related protein [Thermoplasmata archaeon]